MFFAQMRYLRGNSKGIWNDAKKQHALAGRVAFATIPLDAPCYRLFSAEFWMKKGAGIGFIGDSYIFIRGQLFGVVKVLLRKGLGVVFVLFCKKDLKSETRNRAKSALRWVR